MNSPPEWPTGERVAPLNLIPQAVESLRKDLQHARRAATTTGKVIPELKFVFWQKMFTQRHDTRLWEPHLRRVLPHLAAQYSVAQLREQIYSRLERIRALRNRIAHHEPIFMRDLADDYATLLDVIGSPCRLTAGWLDENQLVTGLIRRKLAA